MALDREDTEHGQFKFPPCWKDNAVMQQRFSTFRERHWDVQEYDTKMNFWTELIGNYLRFHGRPIISLRDLQLLFMRGDQLPACLDTVILELQQRKQIRALSEFEYDPGNSWSGWLVNSLVKRPLSWGWLKIKHSVVAEDLEASTLVEWIHLNALNVSKIQTKDTFFYENLKIFRALAT